MLGEGIVSLATASPAIACSAAKSSPKIVCASPMRPVTAGATGWNVIVPPSLWNSTWLRSSERWTPSRP